jgi:tRNA (5-methylaminomethyl-2-thiouridylate)-methyltransferase
MKIAVLVSGGVDSSVALRILKDQGHEVTAFYLKIWLEDELAYLGECPWEEDLAYVRTLCDDLNVELQVISLQSEYHTRIVEQTIAQVKSGLTPNPDILCNQHIKFGVFYEKIESSYDLVATGHYAQVEHVHGMVRLRCAPDKVKDQTYFLSQLTQAQLARALFPIGHLQKQQVRELAQHYNLPTKDRKDSQGICFLGKIKFRDFVKHHLGNATGDIVEIETGNVVGTHDGFWYYTIGQRKGLKLSHGPWYVVSKDVDRNIVYISRRYHAPENERNTFYITHCNWIAGEWPDTSKKLDIKIRHGEQMHSGRLIRYDDNKGLVVLDKRDQGIASGQSAVFYNEGICLGGGIISS